MELLLVPDTKDPIEHRSKMTAEYGVATLDMLRPFWNCSSCQQPVPCETPVLPFVGYDSLGAAVATYEGFATNLAQSKYSLGQVEGEELAVSIHRNTGQPWLCPRCGGVPRLSHVDVHIFNSWLQRDLVLRVAPGAQAQFAAFTPPATYQPLSATAELERSVASDALLRKLGIAHDNDDIDGGAAAMVEAVRRIPGDTSLAEHMAWFNNQGRSDVVKAFADAHMQANPGSAEGHFWKAQVLIQNAASGQGTGALEQAMQLLQTALRIKPDHPDAQVALANAYRVLHRDVEAQAVLRTLLQAHPDHAVANYTLGLMLLDSNPGEAVGCFERGESECPNDPDYPRSRARALLALGRKQEAQAAIARAQQLAPDDPRVQQVASQIGGSNPMARIITCGVIAIVALVLLGVLGIVGYVLWTSGVIPIK